jgi:DNA-binding transcriptional LysR family regulator
VVQEAAQIHTLIGLVSCGFGVALVPESICGSNMRDKVVFRPIRPVAEAANPAIGLYMSWHADNPSPLINSFVAMFETASEH